MDKKKIIQIIVIIAAFGGSGFVLYNGLYSSNSGGAPLPTAVGGAPLAASPVAGGSANALLPFGKTLDFKGTLDYNRFQYDAISFPKLSTSTEVGIYDQASQTYTQPLIYTPDSIPAP